MQVRLICGRHVQLLSRRKPSVLFSTQLTEILTSFLVLLSLIFMIKSLKSMPNAQQMVITMPNPPPHIFLQDNIYSGLCVCQNNHSSALVGGCSAVSLPCVFARCYEAPAEIQKICQRLKMSH